MARVQTILAQQDTSRISWIIQPDRDVRVETKQQENVAFVVMF